MSLMPHVIALVRQMECPEGVDADALMPHCPNHTREQVMQALHNASNRKLVEIRTPSQRAGFGYGSTPGKYGPTKASEPPKVEYPITSVWEMGERAEQGRPFWKPRVPRQDFMTPEVE